METKRCYKCSKTKPVSEFYKNKSKKGGYCQECKDCYKLYAIKNKDKKKAYMKKYLDDTKERVSFLRKKRYLKNIDRVKKYAKEYYKKHEQEYKEKRKIYENKNREMINSRHLEYYKKNKEKILKKVNENVKNKKKTDYLFKLSTTYRSALSRHIKSKKYNKKSKTLELLGCGWFFFKEYIESKFVDGMNWDNYGKWHLDHVIPLSSAKTEEEFYKLWVYTNIQPLWARDNIKKSNKFPQEEELIHDDDED